jgi:hypothetical protein
MNPDELREARAAVAEYERVINTARERIGFCACSPTSKPVEIEED